MTAAARTKNSIPKNVANPFLPTGAQAMVATIPMMDAIPTTTDRIVAKSFTVCRYYHRGK